MKQHNPLVYVEDAKSACEEAIEFSKGKNSEQFVADKVLLAAVERKFSIAGEAINELDRRYPDIASKIPDHRRIIAFRHLLIHGYSKIDPGALWDFLQKDTPALLVALTQLLADIEKS